MIQCQQCGRENADQTQFCRYCGIRLAPGEPMPQQQQGEYQFAPPRPYSWKTDEFQTQADRRVRPAASQGPPAAMPEQATLAYNAPRYMAANYRCPNCGTTTLPITERRISTAGWITFSLLLVFTFIFFWIGLLMKEDVRICPVCRAALN